MPFKVTKNKKTFCAGSFNICILVMVLYKLPSFLVRGKRNRLRLAMFHRFFPLAVACGIDN